MKYVIYLILISPLIVLIMSAETRYDYHESCFSPTVRYVQKQPTIAEYAMSKSSLVYEIVKSETDFKNIACNYSVANGKIVSCKPGRCNCTEFGVAQFKQNTFRENCSGNYRDAQDQIDCLDKMLKEGKGYHWTTYSKAQKSLTSIY
jgi:hypothetical protein